MPARLPLLTAEPRRTTVLGIFFSLSIGFYCVELLAFPPMIAKLNSIPTHNWLQTWRGEGFTVCEGGGHNINHNRRRRRQDTAILAKLTCRPSAIEAAVFALALPLSVSQVGPANFAKDFSLLRHKGLRMYRVTRLAGEYLLLMLSLAKMWAQGYK